MRGNCPTIENTESSFLFFFQFEACKVTASFFGDYHGYWRGQKKGINVIVSGGGEGLLKKWQPEWGKFHHILRITVDQDKATEEVITIQSQFELEDKFEEWIFTNLFPIIQNSMWLLWSIFVLLLMMSGVLFLKFIKTIRRG